MTKKWKARLSLLLCVLLLNVLPGQGGVFEEILGTSLYVEAAAEGSSSASSSASVVLEGDEGDKGNIHWRVLSNYQLEISGSGPIPEDAFHKQWNGVKFSAIESIYIKKEITEIGEKAFYCFGNNLTTVNFESGSQCTKIGKLAFYGSTIENLDLPEGLVEIGSLAFSENKKLKSVTIPASLETFGNNVFADDISLESVVFEEGSKCKVFPQGTFSLCPIKTLVWPSELEEIKDQVFAYCGFSTYENRIIIPKSVKKIGDIAFAVGFESVFIELAAGSELEPTPIWGDIHHDGYGDDRGAPNEVIVHNAGGGVYHMGSGDFKVAGEGDAVTVSCGACDYSTTLKLDVNNMTSYTGREVNVTYDGKNQWEEVIGKDVIAKDPNLAIPTITYEKKTDTGWSSISFAPKDVGTYRATATIKYTKGTKRSWNHIEWNYIEIPITKEFTITPASIESVAFTDPGTVAGEAPATIQKLAVANSENYTASAISWTPSTTKFGYNQVYTAEITLIAKDNYVFDGNVSIPSGWTKAKSSTSTSLVLTKTYTATAKVKLLSVTDPSVTTQLTELTTLDAQLEILPKTVTVAVEDASVTSMAVTWSLKENTTYSTDWDAENTFVWRINAEEYENFDTNGKKLTGEVTLKNPEETAPEETAPEETAPSVGDIVPDEKTGASVEVLDPDKKEVAYVAPSDKKSKEIKVPDQVVINGTTYQVTKIDDGAFKGNKTVTKISLPSTLNTVGKDAFNGCSKLKTISIPKNVTKIEVNTFKGCSSLTKITLPSSIKLIGKNAFYGCSKLKTIAVPKNVTEVGANAFRGCSTLTKLTLQSKTTKIGANAFNGCKKLKTITIKATKLTTKTVAKNAFKGLPKSTVITVPKKQLKAYKKLFKSKGFNGKVKA